MHAKIKDFHPQGRHTWIGSLPVGDHREAVRLVMEYTPEIPLWIQLPKNPREGMIPQFAPGMPGLVAGDRKIYINNDGSAGFDDELVCFFQDYLDLVSGKLEMDSSRFSLDPADAPGFFILCDELERIQAKPFAVKGQVTGPYTFGLGLTDKEGRAVFYDPALKDAAIKLIAAKARWQVRKLMAFGAPVIIFLDEPALAGFGSSAYISISAQETTAALAEVVDAIHEEGGFAGVHVCANTQWPVVIDSGIDILSFDAYAYFDRLLLFPESVAAFIENGGIIAWGIVPTQNAEEIAGHDTVSLEKIWQGQVKQLEALGFDREFIIDRTIITPSCGTGSLPVDAAMKVIGLCKDLSQRIRGRAG